MVMSGFFYNLGRLAGPAVRKGKWIGSSLVGSEREALAAEYAVGRDLAAEIRRQSSVDDSERARALLDEVGPRLAARVRNKALRLSFQSIHGEQPNAFALPGGFIFVTRPLLELCQWDAHESGFILAHEAAHVIRGHARQRIMNDAVMAAASRAGARLAPGGTMLGQWVREVGLELLRSAYSQGDEFDADDLGARLARAAGYDPRAAVRMLRRLERLAAEADVSRIGEYFSSHPPFHERIARLRPLSGADTPHA